MRGFVNDDIVEPVLVRKKKGAAVGQRRENLREMAREMEMSTKS